jgi:hypothetical protein
MRDGIRLKDLIYLARSSRNSGEDVVQTYYGWRESRALSFAKGMGGAALSILTAWLIPFLKNEYHGASIWLIVITPVTLVVSLAAVGLIAILRMNKIHRSFVHAIVWLQRLQ